MAASIHSRQYQEMIRRVREARQAAGLTQADAARALGVSQSQVSKIERGERKIDPLDLAKLAKLYGKRVEELLPAV